MSDLVSVGVDAAKQAGAYLKERFGGISEITAKGDRNLVTDVDRAAQAIIIDIIDSKFPGHGIIAEEGNSRFEDADHLWIIDPLDGTHNFIRGVPVFGVSIGLVVRGEFSAGVIYMPMDEEFYVGEAGNGSYKNGKAIKVSSLADLKDCSVSFDSGIRYNPGVLLPLLGDIAEGSFNIRMFGSSARALSYCAEGKLDAAVEFEDQPWDSAAGICLIEQAGGEVTDLLGGVMTYKSRGYIASNGAVHRAVFSAVEKHRRK